MLDQQRLIAAISKIFISYGNIDEAITQAIKMTGEFMGIYQIIMIQLKDRLLYYKYEWRSNSCNIQSQLGNILQAKDYIINIIEKFSNKELPYFNMDNHNHNELIKQYNPDVKSFLMLPLYTSEGLWGTLSFEQREVCFKWKTSDIYLGEMISGILSIVLDRSLTESWLMSETIKAKEAAEQSNKAKREFLSRINHEIRTPMNAIIGITSIAKKTDNTKKDYCLSRIDDASKQLMSVINNILDISQLEVNKLKLVNTEINIRDAILTITDIIAPQSEEKKQKLSVKIDDNLPSVIVGDESRLCQVISNILQNAIKFTHIGGEISLYAVKVKDNGSECEIQIDITDNGIGIAKDQQAKLFHAFEQIDGGIDRKYGGTGLGLAISKEIVEMMGGKLWVESELGQGAKFSFVINVKYIGVNTSDFFIKLENHKKPINQEEATNMVPNDYTGYMPVINVEDAIHRLMNNKKLYLTLIKNFDGLKMAGEIINAIDENDLDKTLKAAHALKGVTANLGLNELNTMAASIENRAKMGIEASDLVNPLNEVAEKTVRIIKELLENEGIK